jgi:hypothetical protein
VTSCEEEETALHPRKFQIYLFAIFSPEQRHSMRVFPASEEGQGQRDLEPWEKCASELLRQLKSVMYEKHVSE